MHQIRFWLKAQVRKWLRSVDPTGRPFLASQTVWLNFRVGWLRSGTGKRWRMDS